MNNKKNLMSVSAALLIFLSPWNTVQAALDISTTPLFLSVNLPPNVIMTLDDSGSMTNAFMPDAKAPVPENSSDFNLKRYSSYPWNAQYYNPNFTYSIPKRIDPLGSESITYTTTFTNAYENGLNSARGAKNLSNNFVLPYQCFPDTGCPPMPCMNKDSLTEVKQQDNSVIPVVCTQWTTFTDPQAAYYHLYYIDQSIQAKPNGCTDSREDESCYVYIKVGSEQDVAKGSIEQKERNFAIWYSFYRTRALATMSAAISAVSSLGENEIRLAWQVPISRFAVPARNFARVNPGCLDLMQDPNRAAQTKNAGTVCQGDDDTLHENRMRPLDALKTGSESVTHRNDFFDWLEHMQFGSSTPLRGSMKRAGEYYKSSGTNSPYADNPYVASKEDEVVELSCRRNFHILFTDGLWNSENTTSFGGNVDGTDRNLPSSDSTITSYSARAPYSDAYANSLSDLAFLYWSTDLRDDLPNTIPSQIIESSSSPESEFWNPKNNPASWQHMVNFTIGLGLTQVMGKKGLPVWSGSTYTGAYPDLVAGRTAWPMTDGANVITGKEPAGHVYDLWHAAINSRGQFFSADNPEDVVKAFDTVFSSIVSSSGASAAVASSASSLSADSQTLRFKASLNSKYWYGTVTATPIDPDTGATSSTDAWAASFPDHASRRIFTWDGNSGALFNNCATLTTAQRAALNKDANGTTDGLCTDRLDWLRGDSSKETQKPDGIFRNRTQSILGDITHSGPAYVGKFDMELDAYNYDEAEFYRDFANSNASRLPMLYVGANDGMLHAFQADENNANSGKEKFSFVPNAVFSKLSQLTSPAYHHQYYVDGTPTVSDAYFNGAWKTVLVSGLGGGGKSIFALDITDPANFSISNVLWEFTDSELSYTYSRPQIARMNNGDWAAIFGNGYTNSAENPNARAYLYVVRLSDGRLLKRIDAGTETGNGLSTPVVYDTNADGIVDVAYAGDILGNLWKFDLTSGSADSWALGNGTNPLFTAKNENDSAQPITSQPVVSAHPNGGYIVNFGTGRYLSSSDSFDTEVQSLYGIWDNGTNSTIKRSDLQSQEITKRVNTSIGVVRLTSANAVDWSSEKGWYLDLVAPEITAADKEPEKKLELGERLVVSPFLRFGRLFMTTYTPSADKCNPSGTQVLYQLDPLTGARPQIALIDITLDGAINNSDLIGDVAPSSAEMKVGYGGNPSIIANKDNATADTEFNGDGGSGNIRIQIPENSVTRVFWQQLQ